MDIKAFLSSGITHVHTREPQGNFAKSAKAAVLAISMSVAGAAVASQPDGHAAGVADMPYASDEVSALYQALLAPQVDDKLRVVSTRSGAVISMLQFMPKSLTSALNSSPANVAMATRSMDNAPVAISFTAWNPFFESSTESVCLVNAIESVNDNLEHVNGVPHVNLSNMTTVDALSIMAAMSPTEGAQVVMMHELAHCKVNMAKNWRDREETSPAERLFDTAFRETAADLAVVLYYASKEGSFTNGRLAIGAVRSSADNGDHSTLGMLDKILDDLDPEAFVGVPVNEIFDAVPVIADEVWLEQKDEMFTIFVRDLVEGQLLSEKMKGNKSSMELDAKTLSDMKGLSPNFSYNPYAKAQKLIDQVLDHGLRSPDFQRQIGKITVKRIEETANKMGVQPTPEQLIKARFLDPEFSPPGTKGDVGIAGASKFREVNYFDDLKTQATKNFDQVIKSAPRFH